MQSFLEEFVGSARDNFILFLPMSASSDGDVPSVVASSESRRLAIVWMSRDFDLRWGATVFSIGFFGTSCPRWSLFLGAILLNRRRCVGARVIKLVPTCGRVGTFQKVPT